MKKLALFAVLLALILIAGCLQDSFDVGYEKVKEIKARYVVGEQFLPETERELELMQGELSSLKERSNNAALIGFLEIELAKIEMKLRLVKGTAKLQGINLSNVDCSRLQEGLNHLQKAKESGSFALNLINDFQKQHPGEFLKVDFERNRINNLVLSIQNTAVYVNNLKQLTC